jgi:hypothetical protein
MQVTNHEPSIMSRACSIFYDVGQGHIKHISWLFSWFIKPFQIFGKFRYGNTTNDMEKYNEKLFKQLLYVIHALVVR